MVERDRECSSLVRCRNRWHRNGFRRRCVYIIDVMLHLNDNHHIYLHIYIPASLTCSMIHCCANSRASSLLSRNRLSGIARCSCVRPETQAATGGSQAGDPEYKFMVYFCLFLTASRVFVTRTQFTEPTASSSSIMVASTALRFAITPCQGVPFRAFVSKQFRLEFRAGFSFQISSNGILFSSTTQSIFR